MQGDWPRAREHGRRAVEMSRAAGSVVHEFVGLVYVGLPEAQLGDAEGGARSLRRAIAMAQAAGTWVLLGRAHGWLAEIELGRSDAGSALEFARMGLELSTKYGYLFDAALCERVMGQAEAALGDNAGARIWLEAAAEHFAAIQAKPELERTHRAIAALGD